MGWGSNGGKCFLGFFERGGRQGPFKVGEGEVVKEIGAGGKICQP